MNEQLYAMTKTAAERYVRPHLEALEARNKTYTGCGTVRTLAPGATFVLTDHAVHDADRAAQGDAAATFAVVRAKHRVTFAVTQHRLAS